MWKFKNSSIINYLLFKLMFKFLSCRRAFKLFSRMNYSSQQNSWPLWADTRLFAGPSLIHCQYIILLPLLMQLWTLQIRDSRVNKQIRTSFHKFRQAKHNNNRLKFLLSFRPKSIKKKKIRPLRCVIWSREQN